MSASEVARTLLKTNEVINYTKHQDLISRVADKFSTEFMQHLFSAVKNVHFECAKAYLQSSESRRARGKGKIVFSTSPSTSTGGAPPQARKRFTTACTRISEAEPPRLPPPRVGRQATRVEFGERHQLNKRYTLSAR